MSRSTPEWHGKHDDAAIPGSVKERVARKADDCCQSCRREIRGKLRAEFDHIIPLILGGAHQESNLQLLCHECHGAKTKRDVKIKARVQRVHLRQKLKVKKRTSFRGWRKMNGDIVFAKGVRDHGSSDRT